MMTESEFIRLSEELFEHIEDQIDENGWDFDCQFAGNVLTIEAEDGTQIIVNRHTPNQELWIAPKKRRAPFPPPNRTKRGARHGRDFYDVLNEALSAASDEAVNIAKL